MRPRHRRLRVLRLLLGVGETSAPYNQFSLAARDRQEIAICAFFKPAITIPADITMFAGDNTFRGFFQALAAALDGREYDVIHVHKPHVGLLLLARALAHRRRPSLPPIVFTVHNSFQNFSRRNQALLLPMFAFADRVVCCGHQSRQSFPLPFRWLAGRRLDCIPNGVDLERVDRYMERVQPLPPKNDAFTILSVGRLIAMKNPLTLLAAFEKSALAMAKLVFVGDGGSKRELHERITRVGLQTRVQLTGLIPRESVYDHCLRAHLFVSTSKGEGLPIAVLEAMACRLPVILSDIPPHREVVQDGGGFIPLIAPDDVDGFARAIARFAAMPEAERSEIGRRGRSLVEERFTLHAMLDNYEDVYRDVIAARGAPLFADEPLERR